MRTRAILIAASLALAALPLLPGQAAAASTVTMQASLLRFCPDNEVGVPRPLCLPADGLLPVSVDVGTHVVWMYNDPLCTAIAACSHDVVFNDGGGPRLREGKLYERTFTTPGTYEYRCTVHVGQGMVGAIQVG